MAVACDAGDSVHATPGFHEAHGQDQGGGQNHQHQRSIGKVRNTQVLGNRYVQQNTGKILTA